MDQLTGRAVIGTFLWPIVVLGAVFALLMLAAG
jgi:hypothetical protein